MNSITPAAQLWDDMTTEAKTFGQKEPHLQEMLARVVLRHDNLAEALGDLMGGLLESDGLDAGAIAPLVDSTIAEAAARDLHAVLERDPACTHLLQAFLTFKGFKALQAYRLAHKLWQGGEKLRGFLIQGRIGDLWAIDIHPAAKIGTGIMMDHANSIVIGETAAVGDDSSILHGATLGGRGNKREGDRHPKIGKGVFIGTGASILGNIKVGDGARIAAGSIVLQDVPAGATAVGAPARIIDKRFL